MVSIRLNARNPQKKINLYGKKPLGYTVCDMVRISKKAERRAQSPRKRRYSFAEKTGAKKDNLSKGYKEHENALASETVFIPKVK